MLGAAEDVFGKGAEGLAEIVRKSFKDHGQPNGYIVGREAGGAIIFGLRYGSGTLYHKVEGQMPVHWTGPSVGFDIGGDGSKTFALVYNLYNTEDLFRRYPGGRGQGLSDRWVRRQLPAARRRRHRADQAGRRLAAGDQRRLSEIFEKGQGLALLRPFNWPSSGWPA